VSFAYYRGAVAREKQPDARVLFGRAVRKVRLERNLSQERLAELAGIHRTYIGDVERGTRNVGILNMRRIASALGVPLSQLIQEMESD
jgi:transcriptional regulator with XRE-family HTH domain